MAENSSSSFVFAPRVRLCLYTVCHMFYGLSLAHNTYQSQISNDMNIYANPHTIATQQWCIPHNNLLRNPDNDGQSHWVCICHITHTWQREISQPMRAQRGMTSDPSTSLVGCMMQQINRISSGMRHGEDKYWKANTGKKILERKYSPSHRC